MIDYYTMVLLVLCIGLLWAYLFELKNGRKKILEQRIEIEKLASSLNELKKRPKSKEAIEVLRDLEFDGAILQVERIPPDNFYIHSRGS